MAFNFAQIKESLANGDHNRSIKEQAWIKLFGDRKAFQSSIMSPKPKIPNSWLPEQYLEYHKEYGLTKLRALDDWANPDDAYKHYKARLTSSYGASNNDSPDEDQLGLINYVDFCNDINRLTNEMKDDMIDFGVPALQAYIGAYTTMFFVLKRFRKQFYSTLYTFEENVENTIYQKSPLRHLLLFLIERRLNRLIPDSNTFKFGKEYFQTFEYRKESGDAIYDYLIDNYTSDMIACKFLF
ncbi:MAG: hypothetical protein M0R77_15020 [Gammaproteobacteria bacterium]|nr:hypothetical protein [Gammaproteobacteria bacterium]